jgi:hypothetical protein
MIDHEQIRERFTALAPHLDERARRLLAATEARAAGYGGIAAVSQATGVAPSRRGSESAVFGLHGRAETAGP